jgi:hypothetical protein
MIEALIRDVSSKTHISDNPTNQELAGCSNLFERRYRWQSESSIVAGCRSDELIPLCPVDLNDARIGHPRGPVVRGEAIKVLLRGRTQVKAVEFREQLPRPIRNSQLVVPRLDPRRWCRHRNVNGLAVSQPGVPSPGGVEILQTSPRPGLRRVEHNAGRILSYRDHIFAVG